MAASLQPEILAEVNASYTFIIDDLVGFAEGEHQSFVNYVRVIADTERLTNVVIGDQYADASFLEETNDLLYVEHRDRIDAGERLVEQDEARPGRERARYLDPAALAARKGQRRGLSQVSDVEIPQKS